MKREDDDGFDAPMFEHSKRLSVLEEQLYGHVRAAIDMDALFQLEHHLGMVLGDKFEMTQDLSFDLSTQMIEAAIHRVAGDPIRTVQIGGPPDGITEDEKFAVAFDETCQFCVAAKQARDRAKARAGIDDEEEEFCACCEMLREDWREHHADVLVKAGLREPRPPGTPPPPPSGAIWGTARVAKRSSSSTAKRDSARRDKPS
jgi:hypothetical protein